MDRDPARRYQTAADLAADLERFLAHRPIVARPASAMLRLRRSCQRHPTIATAVVLLLLTAITLPVVIQVVREEERPSRRTAAEASARQNLRDAADAIAQMVAQTRSTTITTHAGPRPGAPAPARRCDGAAAFPGQEQRKRPGRADPAHARPDPLGAGPPAARLPRRGPRGTRRRDTAARRTACAGAGRCGPAHRPLLARHGQGRGLDRARQAARGHGGLAGARRRARGSRRHHRTDQLAGGSHHVPQQPVPHAHHAGAPERGFQELQRSLALDARVRATENTPAIVIDSCRMRLNLGTMYRNQGKFEEARREYLVAVADLEPLFAKEPLDPELKRELARARFGVAEIASRRKDKTEAATHRNAAQAAQRELVTAFPDRVAYLQELGMMQFQTSCDLQLEGDLTGAEQQIQAAIESHEQAGRQTRPRRRTAHRTGDVPAPTVRPAVRAQGEPGRAGHHRPRDHDPDRGRRRRAQRPPPHRTRRPAAGTRHLPLARRTLATRPGGNVQLGGTSGLSIGHISPEAAEGGAIGLIEGDIIAINIHERSINVKLSDTELAERRHQMDAKGEDAWSPGPRARRVTQALEAYSLTVTSAAKGAVHDLSQFKQFRVNGRNGAA